MKSSNNNSALKWIYKSSKKYIFAICATALLAVAVALCNIGLALLSKSVLDIATGDKRGNLAFFGALLVATVVFEIIATAIEAMLKATIGARFTINMRNRMFGNISRRKFSEITAYHSGDLLNRVTSDVETISSSLTSVIPNTASILSKILGGVITLIVLDWRVAVIIFAVGITVPAIGRIFSRKYKTIHKEMQRTEGESRAFMQECFENLAVIKTFDGEGSFTKKLNTYFKKNYKLKIKRSIVSVTISLGLFAFFTIGYYLVLIWGAGSISKGVMTFGTLTAFLQLVQQLRAPLQNVSGIIPQYLSALASAERLMEIENGTIDKSLDAEKTAKLKETFKTVSFNNVDFAYGEEEILKNCTFKLERGKITALTGESGSGKSTVFKLILGLYEAQNGEIKVDDIPLDTSIRGLFAYVPQGNMILSGTVRENITLCDETVKEERLIAAAKMACIYDVIETLPEGFETVLSERGGGLSEGQIQRISIARALLTDAPILLLDEATSALDEQTETQVLENIKAMSEKTVLFITHRNTSLKACDTIIHVSGKKFSTVKE